MNLLEKTILNREAIKMNRIKVLSLIFISLAMCACTSNACDKTEISKLFEMKIDLSDALSINKIEKKELVIVDINGEEKSIPFGHINDKWLELKSYYEKGDCLYHFKTPNESWKKLYGREGYVLIRNKKIITSIYTKLN